MEENNVLLYVSVDINPPPPTPRQKKPQIFQKQMILSPCLTAQP